MDGESKKNRHSTKRAALISTPPPKILSYETCRVQLGPITTAMWSHHVSCTSPRNHKPSEAAVSTHKLSSRIPTSDLQKRASTAVRCYAPTTRTTSSPLAPSSRRPLVHLVAQQPRRVLASEAPALVLPQVALQHVLARAVLLAPADHRHPVEHVWGLAPHPLGQRPAVRLGQGHPAADPAGRVRVAVVDRLDVPLEVLRAAEGAFAPALAAGEALRVGPCGGEGGGRGCGTGRCGGLQVVGCGERRGRGGGRARRGRTGRGGFGVSDTRKNGLGGSLGGGNE